MAESSLSAKSASPRELKRWYRAEERTGVGTASSMAARIVHRPSPESDTRPWKSLSSGSLMSAAAERWRGQERRGLPRAHAGPAHASMEVLELRVLDERGRRKVEEPGGDDAPASPHLGDVGQIEVVLVGLGIAQGRRLGVDGMAPLADVGGAQDAQPLGGGAHVAVFYSFVPHLDEVPASVWSAVEVPSLGGAADGLPPRRAGDVTGAG